MDEEFMERPCDNLLFIVDPKHEKPEIIPMMYVRKLSSSIFVENASNGCPSMSELKELDYTETARLVRYLTHLDGNKNKTNLDYDTVCKDLVSLATNCILKCSMKPKLVFQVIELIKYFICYLHKNKGVKYINCIGVGVLIGYIQNNSVLKPSWDIEDVLTLAINVCSYDSNLSLKINKSCWHHLLCVMLHSKYNYIRTETRVNIIQILQKFNYSAFSYDYGAKSLLSCLIFQLHKFNFSYHLIQNLVPFSAGFSKIMAEIKKVFHYSLIENRFEFVINDETKVSTKLTVSMMDEFLTKMLHFFSHALIKVKKLIMDDALCEPDVLKFFMDISGIMRMILEIEPIRNIWENDMLLDTIVDHLPLIMRAIISLQVFLKDSPDRRVCITAVCNPIRFFISRNKDRNTKLLEKMSKIGVVYLQILKKAKNSSIDFDLTEEDLLSCYLRFCTLESNMTT